MAPPHDAFAIDGKRDLARLALLGKARIALIVDRKVRIDPFELAGFIRGIVARRPFVSIDPQVDFIRKKGTQSAYRVEMLAQTDDADAQAHSSLVELLDLGDKGLEVDFRWMIGRPECEPIELAIIDPGQTAGQVGLYDGPFDTGDLGQVR